MSVILFVSSFNHENAMGVGKTALNPQFSRPDLVRGNIPCQLKPKNDNSRLQEDNSGRKTTSHDRAYPLSKLTGTFNVIAKSKLICSNL